MSLPRHGRRHPHPRQWQKRAKKHIFIIPIPSSILQQIRVAILAAASPLHPANAIACSRQIRPPNRHQLSPHHPPPPASSRKIPPPIKKKHPAIGNRTFRFSPLIPLSLLPHSPPPAASRLGQADSEPIPKPPQTSLRANEPFCRQTKSVHFLRTFSSSQAFATPPPTRTRPTSPSFPSFSVF